MSKAHTVGALVIGAGPAGLGAAMGLAHSGMEVTVLERQGMLGSERRGETIRADREMEEIIGPGFFDSIARVRIRRRRYYSHTGSVFVDRTITNPNIVFAWPDLIGRMAECPGMLGVDIRTGVRAIRLADDADAVKGAVALTDLGEETFHAGTVFLCTGSMDTLGKRYFQRPPGMDMAIRKMLVKGYSGIPDRLEYHFHLTPQGMTVGAIFPRSGAEAELLLLSTSPGAAMPGFEEFGRLHPVFQRHTTGVEPFYEMASTVPMGGMIFPFSPKPGLVMAGDILGHVQARGGSGICASFLIGHACGSAAGAVMRKGGWTAESHAAFEREMRRHPRVQGLRMHNLFYSRVRSAIFRTIRSGTDMDRKWPFLRIMLR
jgi:flavin-dependent dehydrogenase